MKQKFSIKWKGSKRPSKQRKYLFNAPNNIRHKLLSTNLSKKLREKYKKRNVPVRKGDSVKIMIGEFKGKTGKINTIDSKNYRVSIENIFRTKKDGSKVSVFFVPSNLQIQELALEDKKRKEAIERTNKELNKTTKEKK